MRLVLPASVVATAALVVCTLPAAQASSTVVAAPSSPAVHRPAPVRATITFVKNQRHPFHSRVVWRVYRYGVLPKATSKTARQAEPRTRHTTRPSTKTRAEHTHKHKVKTKHKARHKNRPHPRRGWHVVQTRSWRAGSGLGGRAGRDGCARNRGWLPNGVYGAMQHDNYWGRVIKGRVFYLGQHTCRNGTVRQQLFIHTETGPGNLQCADLPGDQACRWETPAWNDYRSYGCIKMSPHDLRELVNAYHRYFHAGTAYSLKRFHVRVVG